MGVARSEALSRNVRSTASAQATLGTRPTVASTDSFILKSYRITPTETRTKRRTPKPSRSLRERIKGIREVEVSIVVEHLPLGGTSPPDAGQLYTAAFGVETIGATVVYAPTHPPSQAPVLTWLEFATGLNTSTTAEICEAVDGFACNQMKVSVDKDTMPLIEFSGPARKLIRTGRAVGDCPASTTVTMNTAADSRLFEINSVIGVGTSTGTAGAGHLVTAIDYTAGTLTVTPAVTGTQTDVDIYPLTLWAEASTGGAPTPQVTTVIDFGADTAAEVTAMELTLTNNVRQRRVVGTQYLKDLTQGWRDVEGTISFEATRTDLTKLIRSQYLNVTGVNVTDIVITFGESGQPGSTLTIQNCSMDFSALELPDDGVVGTFTLPFVATSDSATAESEISWVFQTNA